MLHVKAAVSVFKDSLFDLVSNMSKYLRCFFFFFILKYLKGENIFTAASEVFLHVLMFA